MGASLATGKKVKWGSFSLKIKKALGEGGFGYVYLVKDKPTGKCYALKRVLCQDAQSLQVARREAELMRQLGKHPNVVGLIDVYEHAVVDGGRNVGTEVYLLLELCSGGSLADLMKKRPGLPVPQKQLWSTFLDVVRGVHALHSLPQPVSHRDIKAENVLLGDDGHYKLCDFGSASTCNRVLHDKRDMADEEENIQRFTTLMYRAPEMADLYSRMLVGPPADLWALGCLLYTLSYASHPFSDATQLQIVNANVRYCATVPGGQPVDPVALTIMRALMQQQPLLRPTISQLKAAVEHALAGGSAATLPSLAPPSTASSQPSSPPLQSPVTSSAPPPLPHRQPPSSHSPQSPPSTTSPLLQASPSCASPHFPAEVTPPTSAPPLPSPPAVSPPHPHDQPPSQQQWACFSAEDDQPPPLGSRTGNAPLLADNFAAAGSATTVDGFGPGDGFGQGSQDFAAGSGFDQGSVVHHAAASGGSASACEDGFGPRDSFGAVAGFGSGDDFGAANAEPTFGTGSAHVDQVFAFADVLAPYRGANLKVKRSSGVIEGGWQLAAGAQVDAYGMVELVMGELSRDMQFEELMQLNADAVPQQASALPSEHAAVVADLALGDGFGQGSQDFESDRIFQQGPIDSFRSIEAFSSFPVTPPVLPPAVLECSSDILAPFRNKSLKVKRSSGVLDYEWMLTESAQLDANGMLDVVKGDLLRSISFVELKQLNHEILRVALGELTPEEILVGLSLGHNVFQTKP